VKPSRTICRRYANCATWARATWSHVRISPSIRAKGDGPSTGNARFGDIGSVTRYGSVESLKVSLRCGWSPKLMPDTHHRGLTQQDFFSLFSNLLIRQSFRRVQHDLRAYRHALRRFRPTCQQRQLLTVRRVSINGCFARPVLIPPPDHTRRARLKETTDFSNEFLTQDTSPTFGLSRGCPLSSYAERRGPGPPSGDRAPPGAGG